MGRDKALLPYGSKTVFEHVAEQVRNATGRVTLVGDPVKYRRFGYPVLPDSVPDCGPLGGIYTALAAQQAEWNLIVACDMIRVCTSELQAILEQTNHARECVLPIARDGRSQPLCAAYHRSCLRKIEAALKDKHYRVSDLVEKLSCTAVTSSNAELFANINSPSDWERFR